MKLLRRLGLSLVVLAGLLAVHAWSVWSPKAPTYAPSAERAAAGLPMRLRSPAEHDRVRAEHGEPYVLELAAGDGALLYYGAYHSQAPDDPQLAAIRERWSSFRPTVALCEGRRRGHLLGPLLPRVVGLSEAALVHALADRDAVELYSLEPDYAVEVARLLASFDAADVALFFTLRVYWSESGGRADEALADELRRKRTDVEGLRDALPDLAAMDATWSEAGLDGDWRTSQRGMQGVLRKIDLASRRVRGEHMALALIDLVGRGERVFAVVGSGHVIRQEWALRAALGAQPAPDQPGQLDPRGRPGDD